jgi:hypothetical protein
VSQMVAAMLATANPIPKIARANKPVEAECD